MLTDYHVHLRPTTTTGRRARTSPPTNVDRYLAAAEEAGIERARRAPSTSTASSRRSTSGDHPFWERERHATTSTPTASSSATTPLRLGIECDFVPGARGPDRQPARGRDFDYVLGSVHFVGDRAVDHEGWDVWERGGDPDEVWRRYFEALAEAPAAASSTSSPTPTWSRSGARARPLPERDPRFYYEPAVEAIAEAGVAVEVSTAGLRKPVGELYPAPALRRDVRRGGRGLRPLLRRPPRPSEVGYGYEQAVESMRRLGSSEIAVFERRQRTLEPLG